MRVISLIFLVLVALSLLPSTEPKRPGKGRGLKRQKLTRERSRMKALRRQSRSGLSGVVIPNCSEMTQSGEVYLDCQDQSLTFIPSSSTWSRVPNHLLLARNQIKALRGGSFLGYERLSSLDLQQNQISQVDEDAFQGLTHLTTLLLQHNQLRTLSEEALIPMPNLHYLRLYDNPWKCLCPMESLIRTLQVPSNRNLGNHAKCAEPVSLKDRKLKQIDPELLCEEFGPNINLTQTIEPIPIRGKLDATALCHTYIFPVSWLDCRNRGLTEVPSGIPDSVVRVDLSLNQIHHLKPRDFQGAKSLRILNLSNNDMQRIDTGSLSGLLHLQELDLSSNRLHFVQYGVLEDLYFLSKLKLGGNPWMCDYNIHYMVYWLRLHPGVKHSGLLCQSPLEYNGERVEDYVHSYNRDCPKDRQLSRPDQNQRDAELWDSPMELQGEIEEEELEPSHLRVAQKYQIFRLA
ncbi:leucine-rich repeat-containing protein 17-like [Poeciliopsis prolifica]|uniref:leucine-rich repeat-containing protein 17-like n=1 Tax=Poeciliopsis prolifica TaxID=188132 RepID=UPI002413784F|nr:leucine-rich repeat-containing protein 17-like [Poeciliopsis prolifica]XP_054883384.1 leucine-rich repeat-containing protein 17-like [Poeciliopsis prolifica]